MKSQVILSIIRYNVKGEKIIHYISLNDDNTFKFTLDKESASKMNYEDAQRLIPMLELYTEDEVQMQFITHKEIERKWLFDSIKAPYGIEKLGEYFYNQSYISIDPEVRIRSKQKVGEDAISYKLCIKSKGTIERDEIEKELTKEEYDRLKVIGKINKEDIIRKHFYIYNIDGYKLTLGIVDEGRVSEFMYGEIEFDTIKEAMAFEAPRWFGQEITYRNDYKMANYWERTRKK